MELNELKEEIRKSCHRLIDDISDEKLLNSIKKILEHLVRNME